MSAITRPILRWHGGKWMQAPWIISHFGPHRIYTETYFHAWQRDYHPVGAHEDMNRYIIAPRMHNVKKRFGHTTVKPDAVMDKIMANVNGQTVCDPFMGTGSTGVAAIKAGKIFTGIEHNPKHFETAVRRIGAAYKDNYDGNNSPGLKC